MTTTSQDERHHDLVSLGASVLRLIVVSTRGNLDLLRRAVEVERNLRTSPISNRENVATLIDKIIDINLEYYTALSRNSQQLIFDILNEVDVTPREGTPLKQDANSINTIKPDIEVKGHLGETLKIAFMLENRLPRATNVSFQITDFEQDSGDKISAQAVIFNPSELILDPQSEQPIYVHIPLLPPFETKRSYHSIIEVLGDQPYRLSLVIHVEAPMPTEEYTSQTTRARTARRATRQKVNKSQSSNDSQ